MAPRRPPAAEEPIVGALLAWFDVNERPLPWRSSTPWGVFVSEFMLQQTPVQRVLPVWHEWLERWPTPDDLADASLAEALRAWGRLGYPRRAARLHASAIAIRQRFEGRVPESDEDLRGLPGVGEYTSAAVRAFAFGQRSVVMDTNVRRVLARTLDGTAAPRAHIVGAERARADDLWPHAPRRSARWSAAVMEFGALVCTARRPSCDACPVRPDCRWTALDQPGTPAANRRAPKYEGSDRQARGRLLGLLREEVGPVARADLLGAWPDPVQASRALDALVADGLVTSAGRGRFALPGE